MKTPIYDFIKQYISSGALRCHMPGHKGRAVLDELASLYSFDITEIKGADSLFEASGVIAESERNMSQLYGSAATAYSAVGSTLCIQAMLTIMKQEGRRIIAVRNVHRAFLNSAVLLDLDVEWILPDYTDGILSGRISAESVENALKSSSKPACLYVTSPDYTGRMADIQALSAICHKYGARLLVDNAHGAHLAFMPENLHPIHLGADLCCDSAHKMLPALTGAAMLHTSVPGYAPLLKQAMSLFASTSPSYLILTSLDLCCRYISERINSDIALSLSCLEKLRSDFPYARCGIECDPFHITLRAAQSEAPEERLGEVLRRAGVECEYEDDDTVILLTSPLFCKSDYVRLGAALTTGAYAFAGSNAPRRTAAPEHLPKQAMTIRQAALSEAEMIPTEAAEGRICAAVNVPCPPAVPIAASGEIIDRECINIFKSYGISTVNVVK